MELIAHQPLRPGDRDPFGTLRRVAAAVGVARIELDVLYVGGRLVVAHDPRDARRGAPAVADALAALRDTGCAVLLDIKSSATAEPLGELLGSSGWAARSIVSGELSAVQAAAAPSGARRAWTLPSRVDPAVAADAVHHGRCEAVSVRWQGVTPALVDGVHAGGGRVLAWTVDRVRAARRLQAMGVDALITNRPERLRSRLRAV